jgi:hypothetical protein
LLLSGQFMAIPVSEADQIMLNPNAGRCLGGISLRWDPSDICTKHETSCIEHLH